jgi:hypothetical protein
MKTKTIEQAKVFNLYTKDDLPAIYTQPQILNGSIFDYSDKIKSATLELPDECLKGFNPALMFEARQQLKYNSKDVELYYIENHYTIFETTGGNLAMLRHDSRNKKYYFHPFFAYYRQYQFFEHYDRQKALDASGIKEPNYIGKFTSKKVNDWLKYCDDKINFMSDFVAKSDDKNHAIETKIKDFINKSGGNVQAWGENTEVKKGKFRITFAHNRRAQYLSTKIEFEGDLNDVLNLIKN